MTKTSTVPNNEAFTGAFSFPSAGFGKFSEISKQNLEAISAATGALTQGARLIYAQSAAYSKATVESNVAAVQALVAAKSPTEAVQVQTAHLQASIARFASEVSKISETYTSSVKSAATPLRDRAAAALKVVE